MKKFSISYALVFVISTLALSGFFNADSYFEQHRDMEGYIVALSSLILFLASLVYMAFRIYAVEKANSNLKVEFAPFEWLYARSSARHCEATKSPKQSIGIGSLVA